MAISVAQRLKQQGITDEMALSYRHTFSDWEAMEHFGIKCGLAWTRYVDVARHRVQGNHQGEGSTIPEINPNSTHRKSRSLIARLLETNMAQQERIVKDEIELTQLQLENKQLRNRLGGKCELGF